MPILDRNNNKLSPEDRKALEFMIRGSLINHREVVLDVGDEWRQQGLAANDPRAVRWKAYYDNISKVILSAIKGLGEKIQSYAEGDENLTPEQVIDRVFSDMSREITQKWYSNDPKYAAAHERFVEVATKDTEWNDPVISQAVGLKPRDRVHGSKVIYGYSTQEFAFSTKPMKEIYEIADFDAEHDDVKPLSKARSKGSTTLTISADQLQAKLDRIEKKDAKFASNPEYKKASTALSAHKALDKGEELSRRLSVKLQQKDHVSFSDLYIYLVSLHKQINPKSDRSGKLRGVGVTYGRDEGVSTTRAPIITYMALQQIADRMNEVKQEPNRALQKTKAVELAAFAYQTLLSAHVFDDANGRTCRMFADTILQTFHLPPHAPQSLSEMTSLSIATLGSCELDFKSGAKCFMHGIQKSNQIIGYGPKEQFEGREKPICLITGETKAYLRALQNHAQSIRGVFSDSPQYKAFLMSLQGLEQTVDAIMRSRKDPNHNEDLAQQAFEKAVREMKRCAQAYKDYKLADHAYNPEPGSGKKKMNSNDREKMQLMNDILSNRNRQFRRVKANTNKKETVKKLEDSNIL